MALPYRPNNNRRKSFFAEQRESNANPNFINNVDQIVLRNAVKRILRDVSDGLIIPEDYIYFKNWNVLSACLNESFEQYRINQTARHAFTAYYNIILPQGQVSPDTDIQGDTYYANVQITQSTAKECFWKLAYMSFQAIQNGVEPQVALVQIAAYPKNIIKLL